MTLRRAADRALLLLALTAATLCPAGVSLRVSSLSPSIGIAPRTHWEEPSGQRPEPAAAAVRAVLEVVVPSSPVGVPIVCVAGATGCGSSRRGFPSTTTTPSPPIIVIGSAGSRAPGGDRRSTTTPKVFFVDEDSDEDAIRDRKTRKKNKKPSSGVPIIVSYDGWKGKTEDDIPISPYRNRLHPNYDMEHTYSSTTRPTYSSTTRPPYSSTIRPPYSSTTRPTYSSTTGPTYYGLKRRPMYRTVKTNDVPVTFWDVPLGTESTLLVHHLLQTSPLMNVLYTSTTPPPLPTWRPSYGPSNPDWSARGPYPSGLSRPVASPRNSYSPTAGFYGSSQPRVYSRPGSGGARGVWCPPRAPSWPVVRPLYPISSTTTPRPVTGVSDRLDFQESEDESEEQGESGSTEEPIVKVVSKLDLNDFKK